MLALLRDAVNTDSGSYDKAGVDAVGQLFIDFFAEQGLVTTREAHERSAMPSTSASTTRAPTRSPSC